MSACAWMFVNREKFCKDTEVVILVILDVILWVVKRGRVRLLLMLYISVILEFFLQLVLCIALEIKGINNSCHDSIKF